MRRSELFLVIFLFHFASNRLERILLIVGEGSQRLVVATLRWMRGFEGWPIVLSRCLYARLSMWEGHVFLQNLLIAVEKMSFLGFLREWLILHQRLANQSFIFGNLLRSVEVVFHVRYDTTKTGLFSDSAQFSGISYDVSGSGYYFVIIGFITVVFLYNLEIFHMLKRRLVQILSDVLSRSECLIISDLNLSRSILFPDEC